jgi:hypothetical protein
MDEKAEKVSEDISDYRAQFRKKVRRRFKELGFKEQIEKNICESKFEEVKKKDKRINELLYKIFYCCETNEEEYTIGENRIHLSNDDNRLIIWNRNKMKRIIKFTRIIHEGGIRLENGEYRLSELARKMFEREEDVRKIQELEERLNENQEYYDITEEKMIEKTKIEGDSKEVNYISYDSENIIVHRGTDVHMELCLPVYSSFKIDVILENYKACIESYNKAKNLLEESNRVLSDSEDMIIRKFQDSLISEEI